VIANPPVARSGIKVHQGPNQSSWVSDDTSNFAYTGGPLKIKYQAGRTTHEDIGLFKQHMKSLVVTPK
jgi:hypothetical protein